MRLLSKNEKGDVMVEASIILSIVVIFVSFLIYLGMIFYQQTLVTVMANQTASNIAQVYSNELKDPFTGYISVNGLKNVKVTNKLKDEAFKDIIEEKAQWVAKYRLKKQKILKSADEPNVEVDVITKPNELLKAQIVVSVTDTYDFPLAAVFGHNEKMKFVSTGRADCYDLLDYINAVNLLADPDVKDITSLTDNYTVNFYNGETLHDTAVVLQNTSIRGSSSYTSKAHMPSQNPASIDAVFYRWETLDGQEFTADTVVYANTDVYAKWKCTLTFNANGGTVSPDKMTVICGNPVGSLPTPQRGMWKFTGWVISGTNTAFNSSSVADGDLTLVANWTHDHVWVETGRTAWESQSTTEASGIGCNPSTIYYKCRVCGETRSSYDPGGTHNYSGQCTTRHVFADRGFTFKCWGSTSYHSIAYYHCICANCGIDDIDSVYYKTFKYRNKYYSVLRPDLLCAATDRNGREHCAGMNRPRHACRSKRDFEAEYRAIVG